MSDESNPGTPPAAGAILSAGRGHGHCTCTSAKDMLSLSGVLRLSQGSHGHAFFSTAANIMPRFVIDKSRRCLSRYITATMIHEFWALPFSVLLSSKVIAIRMWFDYLLTK